jgi:predicted O-methyltransferase YrrM
MAKCAGGVKPRDGRRMYDTILPVGEGAAMAWDIYNRARARLLAGEPGAALAILRAPGVDPREIASDFACLEAECLRAEGRHDEAVAVLERAAAQGPANYWVFEALAGAYRDRGAFARAAAMARRGHAVLGWEESERHGYVFTHDYFSANIVDWTRHFTRDIVAAPIACLEIGSWQGGSATWLLDKVVGPRGGSLTCIDTFEGSSEHAAWLGGIGATLEDMFDANIARTGKRHLCRKLVGRSQAILPQLYDERFDFIYIDGAHEAKYVIQDALLCWALLPAGGFLLFDDTHFEFADRPEQNTQTAIAAFRTWFGDEMEVLTPGAGRQLLVRKRVG